MLPMLLIVVSSLYLLLDGADEVRHTFLFGVLQSPWFFYPILVVIFAAFAQYSWLSLRKIIRKKLALRWGKAGMTLPSDTRVAWAAVTHMELLCWQKKTFLLVYLDQPVAFVDMQYGERKNEAKHNCKRFHTPVAINCHELDTDAHVLLDALQWQYRQFCEQSCSKP